LLVPPFPSSWLAEETQVQILNADDRQFAN
jgi:hypothetical protein